MFYSLGTRLRDGRCTLEASPEVNCHQSLHPARPTVVGREKLARIEESAVDEPKCPKARGGEEQTIGSVLVVGAAFFKFGAQKSCGEIDVCRDVLARGPDRLALFHDDIAQRTQTRVRGLALIIGGDS